MISISLCMIVKDEEASLDKCLSSAKDIVDEIIIVDTGSTDRTKEIARKYTSNIEDFVWIDDFSAARNYSFSKATKDYILWLDADDIIHEEDQIKLLQLKKDLKPTVDVLLMKYNVGFDEDGHVTLSYYRERLIKNGKGFKWRDPIHEYIETNGIIQLEDISITHAKIKEKDNGRNLRIFNTMIENGHEFSARNVFYYARELYYNGEYIKAIMQFNCFLDKGEGWLEDNINACYLLSICYELTHNTEDAFNSLYKSFKYGVPRAEVCCRIADLYFNSEQYQNSIFWYTIATTLEKPSDCWGFLLHDYWDYIPYIQLCLCYYKTGDVEKAMEYNNIALINRPTSKHALYNNEFFCSLK